MAEKIKTNKKFQSAVAQLAYEALLQGIKANHRITVEFEDIERNGTMIPSEWKITVERKA